MRIAEVGRSEPRHGNAMEPLPIGVLERGLAGNHDAMPGELATAMFDHQ
jgi:hypothetical protein